MPRAKVAGGPCLNCLRLEKLLLLHIAAMESARQHLRKANGGAVAHALEDLERHLPEWKGKPREPCG